MEQVIEHVKVNELATEFEIGSSVVISELKKIGVWVPSADTDVDPDIANRIRRRLQLMMELEQEELEKKDKDKKTKAKAKTTKQKTTTTKVRRSIRQLGKPRKKATPVLETEEIESPLARSLAPRKGKAGLYRKVETPEIVEPERIEITLADEPIIEKVEARISEEALEKAMQQPTAAEFPATRIERPKAQEPIEKPETTEAELEKVSQEAGPTETQEPDAEEVPTEADAPEATRIEDSDAEEAATVEPIEVALPRQLTVRELAEKIGVLSKDIVRELMSRGVMASLNHTLNAELIEEITPQFNVIARFVSYEESVLEESVLEDKPEDLSQRPPVVTVMGHVDHGKTSLLDAIRESDVAAGESGGITQHIGAYQVDVNGRQIVFIDTPGHEAFTMMRARGAQVTDIVILVVAADDGLMPQTIEAINHARAAEVPIIVAINKMDKEGAQPDRVKQGLSEQELIPEDWGGDTIVVEISAKEKTNLKELLDYVLLVADLQELTANPERSASGVVLEARLDKGRGTVATLLVQNGSVRAGDTLVAGSSSGKIRAMFDDRGKGISKTGPGSVVEVLGLQVVPEAGDDFQVMDDAGKIRQLIEYRQTRQREKDLSRGTRVNLDDFYSQMQEGEVKELSVVVKADTQGSAEVVRDTLEKLSGDQVKVLIIHSGVGAISESDVLLASTSEAVVVGFNVRPERKARDEAERIGIDIRLHTVIYDLTDEIKQAMTGLLEPTFQEKQVGHAEVRDTFKVPKFGIIAGCYVTDGSISRSSSVRLLRDNVVIYEGKLDSLRRFKDDTNEVKSGYECGISIANYNDVKPGDVIEAYIREEVVPKL